MQLKKTPVWLEPDRSKPVEVPECHIVGAGGSYKKAVKIQEDENATAMRKVDLLEEFKFVDIVSNPKSDMVRDYLKVIKNLGYICFDAAFIEAFKKDPMLFRQLIAKDPDHPRRKIYVVFGATTVWIEGSTEPMVPIAWDAGYEVRSAYTSCLKVGNDERAKFVTPAFMGNYFATKDPLRVR